MRQGGCLSRAGSGRLGGAGQDESGQGETGWVRHVGEAGKARSRTKAGRFRAACCGCGGREDTRRAPSPTCLAFTLVRLDEADPHPTQERILGGASPSFPDPEPGHVVFLLVWVRQL